MLYCKCFVKKKKVLPYIFLSVFFELCYTYITVFISIKLNKIHLSKKKTKETTIIVT